MRTTILYTVHNNYLVFRASVESLLAHVPRKCYERLLVVDDCSSDEALLGFLERLSADLDFMEVVHTGEPSDLSYHNNAGAGGKRQYGGGGDVLRGDRSGGVAGDKTVSKGHGASVNIGLERVKTEFAFVVDSDILFMEKSSSMIQAMEACMDMDPAIMNVGQLVNRIDGIRVFDKPFRVPETDTDRYLDQLRQRVLRTRNTSKKTDIVREMRRIDASRGADAEGEPVEADTEGATPVHERIGWPNLLGCLSRLSAWRKHQLPLMNNGGWIGVEYSPALFARGFKTCNFNVFKDGYLVHLGYGTMLVTRKGHAQRGFYFSRCDSPWWGRSFGHNGWWYGYFGVPYTTEQFQKILESTYTKLDFSSRMNVVTFEGEQII